MQLGAIHTTVSSAAKGAPGTGGRRTLRTIALLGAGLFCFSSASTTAAEDLTKTRLGVVMWGLDTDGQCQVPPLPLDLKNVQVACGARHTLSLRSDGRLVAWGANDFGQCNVPLPPPGTQFVRVAASNHSLALTNDGQVLAWGRDDFGQAQVPLLPPGVVFASVSAGACHSAALCDDGSIVCWGDNTYGQCKVPALPAGLNFVSVVAGAYHTVALCNDGSLVAWGLNKSGQCDLAKIPPRLTCLAVSAGAQHTLALMSDRSLLAWGSNSKGQCDIPGLPPDHALVEISAGAFHNLARFDDGTVLAWGDDSFGQLDVPKHLGGLLAVRISAGGAHSAAQVQHAGDPWVAFCTGDRLLDACPCNNESLPGEQAGCRNSTKFGGQLSASGVPSLAADGLRLQVTHLPGTFGVILQGPPADLGGPGNPVKGTAWGDGMYCLGGPSLRLAVCSARLGAFVFPTATDPMLSKLGGIAVPGAVSYQVWYREPSPVCSKMALNLTNALKVLWAP